MYQHHTLRPRHVTSGSPLGSSRELTRHKGPLLGNPLGRLVTEDPTAGHSTGMHEEK